MEWNNTNKNKLHRRRNTITQLIFLDLNNFLRSSESFARSRFENESQGVVDVFSWFCCENGLEIVNNMDNSISINALKVGG